MLIPQLMWCGVSLAFYTGLFVPIITGNMVNEDDNEKFYKGIMAMVSLGIGEICGSLS